jgi:class 3 adenylate cyclase/tetratricopeptide (TPR) repeat protein
MPEIGDWLNGLGLGAYTDAFEREQIDFAALPTLSDADLRELGLPMGPRNKLKAAIAALSSPGEVSMSAPLPAQLKPVTSSAERRQLTVLFCDLVGSTELSQRLDPEEYRDLVRAYQTACTDVIAKYDGHVAQYLGDGLLVYFGYPKAHEDDAQRAVRAGLGIVEVLSTLKTSAGPLSVRVGLHTGLVVVGDVGSGSTQEQLALGDTPNVAARLQALAPAGAVLLSDHTRRLTGENFEYEDTGSHSLKGIASPVHAWRALGQRRAESRFEATHHGPLAPMVGRDSEFTALMHAWQPAKSGNGQAVMLCGEAGIGKSRILRALRDRLTGEGISPWQYQCSPYFANTALYPVVDSLDRILKVDRDDTAEGRLDRLDKVLSQYGRPARDVNLIARLLSLPVEARYGPLGLSPQKQKEETLRALIDLIESAAASSPVLMLFEDLHWADPTTLELLQLLLARLEKLRVLLVITHRPEFQPTWSGLPRIVTLALTRLDAAQTQAIAARIAGVKPLPGEIVAEIIAKTDGIPLFVEELTKAILESGIVRDAGERYDLSAPLSTLAIPNTLRDSLMARLDRLSPVKEVAQIGACVGREFGYDLLSMVSPIKGALLDDALAQLVNAELVFRRESGGEQRFVFKHALVQDAAYDSLLKSRRAQLHAQVAQALEQHFPQTAKLEPELLARHYTAADLPQQAIPYWLEAGRVATARSANREAIGHLSRGVELVLAQPPSQQRDRTELDFRVSLTTPIIATHGWGTPEFEEAYRLAVDLCDRVDDPDLVSRALYMQWGYGTWTARHRIAEQAATRMLAMAEARGQRVARLMGHGLLGRVQCYLGNIRDGRRNIEQSLALADPEQDRALALKYGQDPVMAGLAGLSWCLWLLGYPGQARQARDQAIERAELIKHPQTLSYALSVGVGIYGLLDLDLKDLEPRLSRLERLVDEQGFNHWRGYVLTGRAIILCAQGDKQAAREAAHEGVVACKAVGCGIFAPLWGSIRARVLLADGATAEAMREVEEALAAVRRTEEAFAVAEVQRVRGEIFWALHEERSAVECFDAALATARAQGARMLELRATTSYAQVLVDRGRNERARQLLEPMCASFSAEPPTPDIAQARALAAQLGALSPFPAIAR